MQPLFFLPGMSAGELINVDQSLSLTALEPWGLATLFADRQAAGEFGMNQLPGRGPSGEGGCLLYWEVPGKYPPTQPGYYSQHQRWSQVAADEWDVAVPPSQACWIGLEQRFPPKPADFALPIQVRGHAVTLSDGQAWLVPTVRNLNDEGHLPQRYFFQGGQVLWQLEPQYQALWEEMTVALEMFCGQRREIGLTASLRLCLHCLQVNYRLNWPLVNRLGLLSNTNWQAVLAVAVDHAALEQLLAWAEDVAKKNSPAAANWFPRLGSSSVAGAEDSPSTPPPVGAN